jgi:hypothetical protein
MNPGDKIPRLLAPELIGKPWPGADAWRESEIIAEFAEATDRCNGARAAVCISGGARTPPGQRPDQSTGEPARHSSSAGLTTISRGSLGLMDWIRATLAEQGMSDSLGVMQTIDEPADLVHAICERYAKRRVGAPACEREPRPDL